MAGHSPQIFTLSRGLPPLAGPEPLVLILGSFPSILSLAHNEYYGNPKNRFWTIMEALFDILVSHPYPERSSCLARNRVALWDVIRTCARAGSADCRIRNPVPNDIAGFLRKHPSIRLIALNGSTAGRLYRRFNVALDIPFVVLPSTSPANAAVTYAEKVKAWGIIKTAFRQDNEDS